MKGILAKATRPKGTKSHWNKENVDDGYSLGLGAPQEDNEDSWFGHGGAWGTNCQVNWHKKQLKLWAVQLTGGPRPWDGAREEAAQKFFKAAQDKSLDAYTGRTK